MIVVSILMKEFQMKDFVRATSFLGMRITHNLGKDIFIDQSSYLRKLLEMFDMTSCNTVSTPMNTNVKLFGNDQQDDTFDMRNTLIRN